MASERWAGERRWADSAGDAGTDARGHSHGAERHGLPAMLMSGTLALAVLAALGAGGLALRGKTAAAQTATSQPADAVLGQARLFAATTATATQAASRRAPAAAAATTASTGQQAAQAQAAPASSTSPSAVAASPAAAGSVPATTTAAAAVADNDQLRAGAALSASVLPLEREHKVESGETLSAIASRYGLVTDTLVMNNAGVTDRDMLKIGQTLRIPPKDGLLYEVRLGESLQVIARRYGVEPAAILGEPSNMLSSPDVVREGQVLLVPGAKVVIPTPTAVVPAPTVARTQAPAGTRTPAGTAGPATPVRPASGGWMWPITGPLSSYFGPSHPLGIDVDLYGRAGSPILAARGGVVTFAGGNPCCSYGYYVEIDHGDGFTTIYSHFNAPPPVRIGQTVAQGQVVGYAGTTGYSTGVHLHFEIRKGGVPVNPLAYLP